MTQFKKIASKSVIVLLIFLTTTTYGFLPNDDYPATSRPAVQRDRTISFDRRRQVDRNVPAIKNSARQLDQKDRIYENLYDRRSFRTGTLDERRSSRNLENNRITVSRRAEPENIRVSLDNRRIDETVVNRRVVQSFSSRNDARRDVRDTRKDSSRNRDSRADLSESDSVRQSRNARVNSRSTGEVRYASRYSPSRDTLTRTDSTRYLKEQRSDIARERQRDSREGYRRSFERMSYERRSGQEHNNALVQRNYRDSRARHVFGVDNERRNSFRTSVHDSTRDGQLRRLETSAESLNRGSGRYIIPQRRVLASYDAFRRTATNHSQRMGHNVELFEDDGVHAKQMLSGNSWINVAQFVLGIYMVWQILEKSTPKRHFKFSNMFSSKEKIN